MDMRSLGSHVALRYKYYIKIEGNKVVGRSVYIIQHLPPKTRWNSY
jgi:hypothetical protein